MLFCDATIDHMKQASVRDLRYHFNEVEHLLREGEEIQITKRKRVIARLLPATPAAEAKRPDFKARLKQIYGDKVLKVSGAELLAKERTRY
jgi:antitoxin (DNA-binding transcriptional repressor) of toxin-antitoxin stability system